MKKLTLEEVKLRIAEIESVVNDDEVAHWKIDDLRNQFITSCAEGLYRITEVVQIAKLVIKTNELDVQLWYA